MSISERNLSDPRILRTRQALQNALRELLRQKPFQDILVQDITEAAAVNRATFYDHFTEKVDLFNSLISSDFDKLLERRNVCFDGTCSSGLAAIILAAGDYLQQMHSEHATCPGPSTGPLVDTAVTLAIRRIILEGLNKHPNDSSAPRELIASIVSGAIHGGVKESLAQTSWQMDEERLLALIPLIQPLMGRGADHVPHFATTDPPQGKARVRRRGSS